MVEKGWLGGGNTGRNTTIIRSNYLFDESAALYEHALKLWEGLSQDLNYNVMYSPRGVMMLAHNAARRSGFKRHVHANRLNGIDNEWLTPRRQGFLPAAQHRRDRATRSSARALQRRGGTARHDAVAWGYARARRRARRRHHSELRSHRHSPRRIDGAVEVSRRRAALSAPGRSASSPPAIPASCMAMAGIRLPLESYPLQALVIRAGQASHVRAWSCRTPFMPISPSPTKANWSSAPAPTPTPPIRSAAALHIADHTLDAICELFPMFRRLRMLRNWGGIVDVTPDRSPIIAKTPVQGLYVNCGWGTGGFKATPGSATCSPTPSRKDEPHPINAPFTLERFRDRAS